MQQNKQIQRNKKAKAKQAVAKLKMSRRINKRTIDYLVAWVNVEKYKFVLKNVSFDEERGGTRRTHSIKGGASSWVSLCQVYF